MIFEAKYFAVIDKPAGLLTHHTHFWARGERRYSSEFEPALTDWVLGKYPETGLVGDVPESRPGLVHRLDKGTSGAMIIARTQSAFLYFKKLFWEQKIRKTYLALVAGEPLPPSGVIDKPIGIAGTSLRRSAGSAEMKKSAPAVTEYKTIKSLSSPSTGSGTNIYSLLEVRPRTGRTHQIRVHLSAIGCAVVGDKLYGGAPAERLMLHASTLEFDAPDGRHLTIDAPLPEDFSQRLTAVSR